MSEKSKILHIRNSKFEKNTICTLYIIMFFSQIEQLNITVDTVLCERKKFQLKLLFHRKQPTKGRRIIGAEI